MSGTYNALYIVPRALYMFPRQSFIYFETMLSIEENMSNQEPQVLNRWHDYFANGGSADFETFYSHSKVNQKLLVKVARGKMSLDNYRYFL